MPPGPPVTKARGGFVPGMSKARHSKRGKKRHKRGSRY